MSDIDKEKTEKSEDKKDIEVEEREKMLNEENKAQDAKQKEALGDTGDDKKAAKEMKEGMEVKPKKIPIGGIQMPGFFTRSKSKERCKVNIYFEYGYLDTAYPIVDSTQGIRFQGQTLFTSENDF